MAWPISAREIAQRLPESSRLSGRPGTAVAVEDLARVSPLLHRHVIPNGTYHFPRAIEGVNLS